MLCDSEVHNIKVCTLSCKYFVAATLQQLAYNSEVQRLFYISLQILFSVLLCTVVFFSGQNKIKPHITKQEKHSKIIQTMMECCHCVCVQPGT